jgi:hypothetical protein
MLYRLNFIVNIFDIKIFEIWHYQLPVLWTYNDSSSKNYILSLWKISRKLDCYFSAIILRISCFISYPYLVIYGQLKISNFEKNLEKFSKKILAESFLFFSWMQKTVLWYLIRFVCDETVKSLASKKIPKVRQKYHPILLRTTSSSIQKQCVKIIFFISLKKYF